jgi:hypothetical protein
VALYPGKDSVLLDLDQRSTVALKAGDAVLGTLGPRAIFRRDHQLMLRDVTADSEVVLADGLRSTRSLANGPWVAIAPLVANLETGALAGRVERRPLALAPDGRVLTARGGDADAEHLATGPLAWERPIPADVLDAGAD